MSTVMKYLQKHSYDISGELHLHLLLYYQLVNAVSFGGLSNLTSKSSECYGGRMTINSLRIGRDLSNVAIKFQAAKLIETRFDKIIARF
jgi:hypothetical protein